MTLRLTQDGLSAAADEPALDALAATFAAEHAVVLPGLLDARLFDRAQQLLADAPFFEREHRGVGRESCCQAGAAFGMLEFLVNDPHMLGLAERISGVRPLRCFQGRLYRLAPGLHYDGWHDDWHDGRLVGMSLNLSDGPYAGGDLELRSAEGERPLGRFENRTPGGCVIFRLSPELQHRVGPVSGERPKTAFAGWFKAAPDFRDVVAGRVRPEGA